MTASTSGHEAPGGDPRPDTEHRPDTEQLREQIEATREELGQTVQALAAKVDVKARAQNAVGSAVSDVRKTAEHLAADAWDVSTGILRRVQRLIPGPIRRKASETAHQAIDTVRRRR